MSLEAALEAAPRTAGVFQVRTEAVRAYPRGRSAMAHYGSGEDLHAAVAAWGEGEPDDGLRVRLMTELGGKAHAEVLEGLVVRFVDRFGLAPRLG